MGSLLKAVRQYVQRHHLLEAGQTVVVGVSGGPDSLCLLHLLHALADEMALRLHVAHLNHGLRGAEADADAEFVAGFAAGLGLPCMIGRADVRVLAAESGLSLEEAARQARYRFLAEVARAAGTATIAVGHNADDQAETVLMHFLRGSGLAGLRGMLPKTPLGEYRLGAPSSGQSMPQAGGAGDVEVAQAGSLCYMDAQAGSLCYIVRPLLAIPRSAILSYCADHGLQPRFDRSNEDTTFFRNRLRHELLPILEQYNPAIREVLTHTAAVLAGDHEIVRTAIQEAWSQIAHISATAQGGEVYFDLAGWRALPLGLQRGLLREAIHCLRASLRNINWVHVERALWLCREGETGQKATLAAGLEVEIGYRALRVGPEVAPPAARGWSAWHAGAPTPAPRLADAVRLAVPGRTAIGGGWCAEVRAVRRADLPADLAGGDPWTACLDARAIGPELTLRPRRPGDRFQPQGMAGHSMKLNEFMINVKLPKDLRDGWPLLIGAAGIAWVCGLRVAGWAAVTPQTEEVWIVTLVRCPDEEG
ncbi:MAG: tRNA lysidine(34) synthetase TilS [Anaerolineae bacterium]